jgi:hypothetical protein
MNTTLPLPLQDKWALGPFDESLLLFSQTEDTRILLPEDTASNIAAAPAAEIGTPELDKVQEDSSDESDDYFSYSTSEDGYVYMPLMSRMNDNAIFREYGQQEDDIDPGNSTSFSHFDRSDDSDDECSRGQLDELSSFDGQDPITFESDTESMIEDDTVPLIDSLTVSENPSQPVLLRFTLPVEPKQEEDWFYPAPSTTQQHNNDDQDEVFSDDGSIWSSEDLELFQKPETHIPKPPKKRIRTKYRRPVEKKEAVIVENNYFAVPCEPRKKRGRPRKNPAYTVVQKAALDRVGRMKSVEICGPDDLVELNGGEKVVEAIDEEVRRSESVEDVEEVLAGGRGGRAGRAAKRKSFLDESVDEYVDELCRPTM